MRSLFTFNLKQRFVFFAFVCLHFISLSQNAIQRQKIYSQFPVSNEYYGFDVCVAGDYAAVGCPIKDTYSDSGMTVGHGMVAILKKTNGWYHYQTLFATDTSNQALLGTSVSMVGNDIFAGAPGENYDENGNFTSGAGALYVFQKDTTEQWVETQKIVPANYTNVSDFGFAVDADSSTLVVGAPTGDINSIAGYVFIYEKIGSQWVQSQMLVPSDGDGKDKFGNSVSIHGDWLVVGARDHCFDTNHVDTVQRAGAAYVFHRVNGVWSEMQKIHAPNRAVDDAFGSAVSIWGDQIAVGAEFEDEDENDSTFLDLSGSTYVFTLNGGIWSQSAKIVAEDRKPDDGFGNALHLVGDTLLVGASKEGISSIFLPDYGAVYVYIRNNGNWEQKTKIVAGDRNSFDYFGKSVYFTSDLVFIGAYNDIPNPQNVYNTGSVYTFKYCRGDIINQNTTACGSYTSPSGQHVWTQSGQYWDTVVVPFGCDSVFKIDLTILPIPQGYEYVDACESFTWINGVTYTSTIYNQMHTIPNGAVNGCDSVATLNLTITDVSQQILSTDSSLYAQQTGGSYQWLDCDNNFAVIPGATNRFFYPSSNGEYAVQITKGPCVDTSACRNFELLSLGEMTKLEGVNIYPNPSSGRFNVEFSNHQEQVLAEIFDLNGKLISSSHYTDVVKMELSVTEESGIYVLKLSSNQAQAFHKLIKK